MAVEIITKSFEYKIRKNAAFELAAQKALDDSRFVYNCALEQRILRHRQGKPIRYVEQSRELTEARHELTEIGSVLRTIQQSALIHLDQAFNRFFLRLNSNKKPGFPRFKSASQYRTFSQQISSELKPSLQGDKLTVPGVGLVRVRLSRPIEGKVKQLRITRRIDGWYAILVCDLLKPMPLPITGQNVGVDLGLTHFATLSTGEQIDNPRFLRRKEKALKRSHRVLSRRKKQSQSRKKARQRLALQYLKISRARKDFHHKTALNLVRRFDAIAVEKIQIQNIVQNRHLAKSVMDAGWGQFLTIMKCKAENAGRTFERVNPQSTSQTCSRCGIYQKTPFDRRDFKCLNCGFKIQRDHNAAINIRIRAGSPELTLVESHPARGNQTRLKIGMFSVTFH